jgi:hypothetical protein
MPGTKMIQTNLPEPLTADDLAGDLVQPGHPLFGVVWVNRERTSGSPCSAGYASSSGRIAGGIPYPLA